MTERVPPGTQLVDGRIFIDGGPSTRGWHFHEDMLRCPQLWAYKHRLQIVFPTSVPLARGILIHVALSHYYGRIKVHQNGGDVNSIHEPLESLRVCAHMEDEKLGQLRDDGQPMRRGVKLADELEIVSEALVAYMAKYAYQDITVYAVEEELRAYIPPKTVEMVEALPLDDLCPVGLRVGNHRRGSMHEGYMCTCPGGYLYTQRPDMLARLDGWDWTVDYKGRGRKDYRQTRGYCMSGQFQGYGIFGEDLFGETFGGRLLDYITWGKDSGDGRKAPQFERVVPDRKPWAERAFPDTIRHSERMQHMLRDESPWNYPKTFIENGGCEHRYGPCPGQDLCSIGPAALGTIGAEPPEDIW